MMVPLTLISDYYCVLLPIFPFSTPIVDQSMASEGTVCLPAKSSECHFRQSSLEEPYLPVIIQRSLIEMSTKELVVSLFAFGSNFIMIGFGSGSYSNAVLKTIKMASGIKGELYFIANCSFYV